MERVILASASPRRKELLSLLFPAFEVLVSGCNEDVDPSASASEAVSIIAERKAEGVADLIPSGLIIAADTVVTVDGLILGKPSDIEDAHRMLRLLSGRAHEVYSGVCLLDKSENGNIKRIFYEKTEVFFEELSDKEIEDYIASGEPMDKAGAYGIQGLASKFIKKIDGDYFNVVGLPVSSIYRHIKELNNET